MRGRRFDLRSCLLFGFSVALLAGSGCTSEQLYNSAQGWQKNECNRIVDMNERARCLQNAGPSYDEHKKQAAESAKSY